MLVGVGTRDHSPYKTCLTHGFVVDGAGEKMSKSRGNVVLPEKIITQYGAEVMRLWVAASDYRNDAALRPDPQGPPRATGRSATRCATR